MHREPSGSTRILSVHPRKAQWQEREHAANEDALSGNVFVTNFMVASLMVKMPHQPSDHCAKWRVARVPPLPSALCRSPLLRRKIAAHALYFENGYRSAKSLMISSNGTSV